MAQEYSLYIGKEYGASGYISGHNLPENDRSEYVSGFLSNLTLTEKDLVEFNNVKYAVKGLYYKNQVVVDSGATPGDGPNKIPVEYNLLENGNYYLQATSAGGRGADAPIHPGYIASSLLTETFYKNKDDRIQFWKQNDDTHTTKNYQKYLKEKASKDNQELTIESLTGLDLKQLMGEGAEEDEIEEVVYTWERRRNTLDGYTSIWRGTYTYLNNTIYLSLVDFGYLNMETNAYEPSGFNPAYEKEYGILMVKKDIETDGEKLKYVSYFSDDIDEELYSKYENGSVSSNTFYAGNSTLTQVTNFVNGTPDFKGGDGQFHNEVEIVQSGKIGYVIGSRAARANSLGGDSVVTGIPVDLDGGGIANVNDFGGRGGIFVYDYYKRVTYDKTRPDDGYLKLRFTGPIGSTTYTITVLKDGKITKVSIPEIPMLPGVVVTLKAMIPDTAYEIDYDNSMIYGYLKDRVSGTPVEIASGIMDGTVPDSISGCISGTIQDGIDNSRNDFKLKMYEGVYLKDFKATISAPDYYNVQTITFPMPNKDIIVDLRTKKVKFKITFISDMPIADHEVPTEAEFGETVTLSFEYSSDDYFINESVLIYYLALSPKEVIFEKRNPDNTQSITFIMPARNIIVRAKCDFYFTLTFQLNDRQRIEEQMERMDGRKITNVYVRHFSDIDGQPSEIRSITDFPDITKSKPKTIYDVYVQFVDQKMTLDKANIYGQFASTLIEEAGNFCRTSHGTDGIMIGSPVQVLPVEINSGNHELFQHFRFTMPQMSLIYDLSWVERLYWLTIDTMELYFLKKSVYFSDEYNYDSYNIQRSYLLPREVYPNAVSNEAIKVDMTLVNQFCELIGYNDTYYSESGDPPSYVQIYESANDDLKKDFENSGIKQSYLGRNFEVYVDYNILKLENLLMPKRNLEFFLSVKYWDQKIVHINMNFTSGSFLLAPGEYEVWIGGGKGGDGGGGGQAGEWGAGIYTKLTVRDKFINLSYFTGNMGGGGGDMSGGNAVTDFLAGGSSSGGGSGGGASYFILEQPCQAEGKTTKAVEIDPPAAEYDTEDPMDYGEYEVKLVDNANYTVSISHSWADEDDEVTISVLYVKVGYRLASVIVREAGGNNLITARPVDAANHIYSFTMEDFDVNVSLNITNTDSNGNSGNYPGISHPSNEGEMNEFYDEYGITEAMQKKPNFQGWLAKQKFYTAEPVELGTIGSFMGAYVCGGSGGKGSDGEDGWWGLVDGQDGGPGGNGGGKIENDTSTEPNPGVYYAWLNDDSEGSGQSGGSGDSAGFIASFAGSQSGGGGIPGLGWSTNEINRLTSVTERPNGASIPAKYSIGNFFSRRGQLSRSPQGSFYYGNKLNTVLFEENVTKSEKSYITAGFIVIKHIRAYPM